MSSYYDDEPKPSTDFMRLFSEALRQKEEQLTKRIADAVLAEMEKRFEKKKKYLK